MPEEIPQFKNKSTENKEGLKLRILIADDSKYIRGPLRKMLEGAGHTVVEVTNGRLLLEELNKQQDFDLIITDNSMPEKGVEQPLSGMHALTEIRSGGKFPRYKNTPVILMSTDNFGGALERKVTGLGAKFILKDNLNEQLFTKIDELFPKSGTSK